jgi:hypothetical protein
MSEATMNKEKSIGKTPEPKKKSWVKSATGRIGLSVLALAGLSAGAYEAYEHGIIPGIHQTTDTPPTSDISSIFDPNALEQLAGPENITQMTSEEAEAITPPVWDEQSKVMTIDLPFLFESNRIPTLHITKEQNPSIDSLNVITVDGLREKDIVYSPTDGYLEVEKGATMLKSFFIRSKNLKGQDVVVTFSTMGLDPMIDFNNSIGLTADGLCIRIPIKENDLIGALLTSDKLPKHDGQVLIKGNAPYLEKFNLATTFEGKLIQIVKKIPETMRQFKDQAVAFVRRIH